MLLLKHYFIIANVTNLILMPHNKQNTFVAVRKIWIHSRRFCAVVILIYTTASVYSPIAITEEDDDEEDEQENNTFPKSAFPIW